MHVLVVGADSPEVAALAQDLRRELAHPTGPDFAPCRVSWLDAPCTPDGLASDLDNGGLNGLVHGHMHGHIHVHICAQVSACTSAFVKALVNVLTDCHTIARTHGLRHQSSLQDAQILLCGLGSGLAHQPGTVATSLKAQDLALRDALRQAGLAYAVVYGAGPERLQNALRGLRPEALAQNDAAPHHSRWHCEACSDPDCERRLFTGRLGLKAARLAAG